MVLWSPRGDLIAFTKMRKGNLHWSNATDGTGERLLTVKLLSSTIMVSKWSIVFYRETKLVKKERVSNKLCP